MKPPRVVVFTDDDACRARGRGVIATLARALHQGASVAPGLATDLATDVAVVVRMKRAPVRAIEQRCAALLPVARRAGALLLVHTHAALVQPLALDGVWLDGTATTTTIRAARALLPPRALLGVSRHGHDALDADALADVDVVTMSPVRAPHSKPDDARTPLGLSGLRDACTRSAVPVLALGGVDVDDVAACVQHGAHGVAVIGAVQLATDPERALAQLRALCAARLQPTHPSTTIARETR